VSLILGFDTATADTAVAVTSGWEPVSVALIGPGEDGRPVHGRALLGAIEDAVGAAGGWARIDRVAVGLGPGSFTGLRIGVSTARALAQARDIPIVGVLTTSALAAGIAELPESAGRPRLAVVDARRGEVFAALDAAGSGPSEPVVAAPAEIARSFPFGLVDGALAAGDGSVRFRSEIEAAGVEVLSDSNPAHRLSALQICRLGAEMAPGSPGELKPHYLRRPDAERWLERDNGNRTS